MEVRVNASNGTLFDHVCGSGIICWIGMRTVRKEGKEMRSLMTVGTSGSTKPLVTGSQSSVNGKSNEGRVLR